jgi:hypothetical protein
LAQGARVTSEVTVTCTGAIAGEAIAVDTTAFRLDVAGTSANVSCPGAIDADGARPKTSGAHSAGTGLGEDVYSGLNVGNLCIATATAGAAKIPARVSCAVESHLYAIFGIEGDIDKT